MKHLLNFGQVLFANGSKIPESGVVNPRLNGISLKTFIEFMYISGNGQINCANDNIQIRIDLSHFSF
ncbi:hypothetical protein D3C74_462560 [compost metagenome]